MALTVTTFNVQNFGEKRSGQRDRMEQVAFAILALDPAPDIVGLLEITGSETEAICELLDQLCDVINNPPKYMVMKGRKYHYLISEFNGFESYVFIYNPQTVTSITFDIDHKKHFSSKYYTVDTGQAEIHLMLDTIEFYTNKKNFCTEVKEVIVEDEIKKVIYSTFPLIHFDKRSYYRPPALGMFIYEGKIFGVLLWHNMSGNGTVSYSAMIHLAESALIVKQDFKILVDEKAKTIKNLLVTGDFNVDEIEASNSIPDPYAVFVKNKLTKLVTGKNALSILNYYNSGWEYGEGEEPILTAAFDNTFYRCPDLIFVSGEINDLIEILINEKDYLLRFFAQADYVIGGSEISVDVGNEKQLNSHPYAKYIFEKISRFKKDKKMIFSIEDRKIVKQEFMKERLRFRKNKIPRLTESRRILGNERFGQFYDDAFTIYVSPIDFIGERYSRLKEEDEDLQYGDVIFYFRQFISDHLPVSISFK